MSAPVVAMLSLPQARTLYALRGFAKGAERSPSLTELAEACGSSVGSVREALGHLEELGFIRRAAGVRHGIEIVEPAGAVAR